MGLQNFFIEGLDPTGLPAFGASEALQLIRAAKTPSYIGMIFVGPAAPDMVSNPQYSTFLWHNTTTGVVSRWTGATWLPISIGIGSLSGTVITDGTLPWTKVNLAGSTALYLIRVNAANNALEYVSAANLFGAGSFAVNKLVPGVNGQFLRTVLGAATWSTLTGAEIVTLIGAGGLAISNTSGLAAALAALVPPAGIDPTGGISGNAIMIDAGGNVVWQTPPAGGGTTNPTIPTLRVFNATGNWICPASITKIRIRVWGAGGGGSATQCGGSGSYCEGTFAVTSLNNPHTVNVGVGGAAGGGLGGTSSVVDILGTTIIQAFGGNGAVGGLVPGVAGNIEVVGDSSNGTLPADNYLSGGNAPGGGGSGGRYNVVSGVGNLPIQPGGGGCGIAGPNAAGADGRVIIEY